MIIEYNDGVGFSKCGDNAVEKKFKTLDELLNNAIIDGVPIIDNWETIDEIIVNSTFNVSNEIEFIESQYHIKMSKYVLRYNPDYFSTSLWPYNDNAQNDFSLPIQYSELALSKSLVASLEKFDDKILSIIDWDDPSAPSPLSLEERLDIYTEGKKLLELVRMELGEEFEIIDCLDWINPN